MSRLEARASVSLFKPGQRKPEDQERQDRCSVSSGKTQRASVDVDACARMLMGWVRRDTCAVRDNRDTYSFASLTANIAALRVRLPLYFWIVYAREDPRVLFGLHIVYVIRFETTPRSIESCIHSVQYLSEIPRHCLMLIFRRGRAPSSRLSPWVCGCDVQRVLPPLTGRIRDSIYA